MYVNGSIIVMAKKYRESTKSHFNVFFIKPIVFTLNSIDKAHSDTTMM